MSDRRPVQLHGVPLPVVVAALFDVADTPGPANGTRLAEPMTLDDAVEIVEPAWDDRRQTFEISTVRGRTLNLVVERAWRLNVFDYDRVNADGFPLAQAIVDRLGELPDGTFNDFWYHPEWADEVRMWALEVLERVAPGRAWRIRALDRLGAPDQLRNCEIEFVLVRDAWLRADDLVRLQGVDPRDALVQGHAHIFGAVGERSPYLAEIGQKMFDTADAVLATASPGSDMVRTWQAVPHQLGPALAGWALQHEALVLERNRNLS